MGNFSKDPQQVLQDSLNLGYAGVRVEQGVPLLDRDLNLMHDLLASLVRSALAHHIGNGVAAGNTGFLIQGTGASNNFRINAGQILVNGLEVSTAQINYSNQTGVPALTTPGANRQDTVFLDLSLAEVDGTQDNALLNSGDVGSQTSVRQKVISLVRVAENSLTTPAPLAGHTHVSLARLNRGPVAAINAADVTDQRQLGLTLASLEQRVRALEQIHAPIFNPAPNQFAPKLGAPGATTTIFGRNFEIGPLTVVFVNNATLIQANAVVSAPTTTQATVTVPSGVTGQCRITVTNPFGSSTSVDNFNVLAVIVVPAPVFAPSPNQFAPKLGAPGANITIFGTNFNAGTLTATFQNVATLVTANAVVSAPTAAQATVTVPGGVTGLCTITVTNAGGSSTSVDTFNVLP